MTIQEFQEKIKPYLKDDVVKDDTAWADIAESAESVVNDGVKSVIKNKDEILAEKKTLQEKYKTLEDQYSAAKPFIENEVSFDEYNRIKQEYEAFLEKQQEEPDIAKLRDQFYEQGKRTATQELQPKIGEYEKQLEQYKKMQEEMQTKYRDTLKRNELNRAITDLGVKADNFWLKGFYADAEAEYIDAEDRISITLPHPSDPSIGRLPLADWVRIFPQTEQGQRMVVAPRTSGSGARGSDGGPGGNKNVRQQLDGLFVKK